MMQDPSDREKSGIFSRSNRVRSGRGDAREGNCIRPSGQTSNNNSTKGNVTNMDLLIRPSAKERTANQ